MAERDRIKINDLVSKKEREGKIKKVADMSEREKKITFSLILTYKLHKIDNEKCNNLQVNVLFNMVFL